MSFKVLFRHYWQTFFRFCCHSLKLKMNIWIVQRWDFSRQIFSPGIIRGSHIFPGADQTFIRFPDCQLQFHPVQSTLKACCRPVHPVHLSSRLHSAGGSLGPLGFWMRQLNPGKRYKNAICKLDFIMCCWWSQGQDIRDQTVERKPKNPFINQWVIMLLTSC